MHLLENIQKRGIPSVLAVACHMDTRQHNLFKAILRQTLYLSHNLLRLSAADRASRIGNDCKLPEARSGGLSGFPYLL